MIKTIECRSQLGTVAPSMAESPVYDYAALSSRAEFEHLVNKDVTLVIALNIHTGAPSVAFGKETLRAMASGLLPAQEMCVVVFGIDFNTLQLEHLLAALNVVKGYNEYE